MTTRGQRSPERSEIDGRHPRNLHPLVKCGIEHRDGVLVSQMTDALPQATLDRDQIPLVGAEVMGIPVDHDTRARHDMRGGSDADVQAIVVWRPEVVVVGGARCGEGTARRYRPQHESRGRRQGDDAPAWTHQLAAVDDRPPNRVRVDTGGEKLGCAGDSTESPHDVGRVGLVHLPRVTDDQVGGIRAGATGRVGWVDGAGKEWSRSDREPNAACLPGRPAFRDATLPEREAESTSAAPPRAVLATRRTLYDCASASGR